MLIATALVLLEKAIIGFGLVLSSAYECFSVCFKSDIFVCFKKKKLFSGLCASDDTEW